MAFRLYRPDEGKEDQTELTGTENFQETAKHLKEEQTGDAEIGKKDSEAERRFILKNVKEAFWVSSLGLYIGICLVIGLIFGKYLDNIFGTEPIFMYVFIAYGLAAAFLGVYRAIKKYLK